MSHDWKLIIRNLTTPGSPPDPSFVDWSQSPKKASLSFNKIEAKAFFETHKTAQNHGDYSALIKTINELISENSLTHIVLNQPMIMSEEGCANIIYGKDTSYENSLFEIQITAYSTLTIKDLFVSKIRLDCRQGSISLHLTNCTISEIEIFSAHTTSSAASLQISSSRIGQIIAKPKSIENLSVIGGTVLNIVTPPPGADNPFVGNVSFSNVFFPRTSKYIFAGGPQQYRNLRYHLMALHNEKNANIIHSAELAVERETDSSINKLISIIYETFSDFGNSTLRPIYWFCVFSIAVMAIVSFFDGALVQSQTSYIGWQTALIEDSPKGNITRAVVLTVQQILNPLGLLGLKALTIAKNGWILALTSIYSFLSVTLITLFVFSIRRRFKLNA